MKVQYFFICPIILLIDCLFLILPLNFLKFWQWNIVVLCFLSFLACWSKKLWYFHLKKIGVSLIIIVFVFFYFQLYFLHLWKLANANQMLPRELNTTFQITKLLKKDQFQTIIAKTSLPTSAYPQHVYLTWKSEQTPQLNETWQGKLRLRPLTSRLNFKGFDKQKWFFSQSITAYGSVTAVKKISSAHSWRSKLLQKNVEKTQGLRQQGLLLALAFGERAWLSSDMMTIYQKTNTAHLIAISGLHIGLVFLFGFYAMRMMQYVLPQTLRQGVLPYSFCYFGGLSFAFFYAYLAGFSIPTLRALFALFMLIIFRMQRLCLSKWRYFWLVVAILLLFDPKMILSESFWLSFAAVLSLLIWYQFVPLSLWYWRDTLLSRMKCHWLIELCHLQFGLLWLLTPWQLFFFNGVSLWSFLTNLWIVPFFSFLLLPLIFIAIFCQQRELWQWADRLADFIFQYLPTTGWVDVSFNTAFSITLFCSLSFGGLVFFLQSQKTKITPSKLEKFSRINGRKNCFFRLNLSILPTVQSFLWLYAFLILIVLISGGVIIKTWITSFLMPEQWQMTMLDVGQGLAVVIEREQKAILYDTGIAWGKTKNRSSMARLEILPYLQKHGFQLEGIIISHDDLDHSGGLPDIIEAHPQAKIWRSAIFENTLPCVQGETWQWRGLTFEVLSPKNRQTQAKNAQSCVILVSDKKPRLLLMGDAPAQVEKQLIDKLPQVDVLQVGHHGSKTSTTSIFLAKIKPKVALISVGRWNPWHLPNQHVLKKLRFYNITTLSTAQKGATRIIFYNKNFELESVRHDWQPWYQAFIGVES